MMRVLLILDSVEFPAAANPQLGRRLAATLAEMGHEVHLLELWDGQTPPPAAAGVPQHTLAFPDERLMNRALENGAKQGSPLPLRLARLAAHPTAVAAAFRQLVLKRPRRTVDTAKELSRLDRQFHFDAICAVAAPYRSAFALEQLATPAKKLLWQMDPYAANRTYQAPGSWQRESQLLKQMDRVFIMPQAQADFTPGAPLAAHRDKMQVLGLPCLLPAPEVPPHEGLRCTFVGTMAPGIRSPETALALFAALDDPAVTLTLAGPGLDKFPADNARRVLGSRLVTPGAVPTTEGRRLQNEADVLVNLGNQMANQLPSKVYEYLGSGKPILHLAANREDPVLPLLARYPLALVRFDADPAPVARWLSEVRGRRLPYETAAALYPEAAPRRVAEDFLNGIS